MIVKSVNIFRFQYSKNKSDYERHLMDANALTIPL